MNSEIGETAFKQLFPNRKLPNISIDYGKLHGFNANVSLSFSRLKINMSKKWEDISDSIKIGCIQELLRKLYKSKKVRTTEIELYNNFIRSLSDRLPSTKSHPVLKDSFDKINNIYFNNELSETNLKIGKGINLLGSYCYQTNTISISNMLLEHPELLDYVMYHEMLHKKHKFYSTKTGRSMHHTYKFRKDEKSYPDAELLEKRLQTLINFTRREKRKNKSFLSRFFN